MRSLKDPTLYGQPDKMTSALYDPSGADDDDGGAVHANDGVGNKTAFLVSQGGTFNGRTVTGIDGSDAGLAKTGRLYLETIPRLTSGSEYADLGRVLTSTCDELAAPGPAASPPATATGPPGRRRHRARPRRRPIRVQRRPRRRSRARPAAA